MRFKFLIIPSILLFQIAGAQNGSASLTLSQETTPATGPAASTSSVVSTDSAPSPIPSTSTLTAIVDYKSVFETATVEEEVKMAAERFNLTTSQQEIWLTAATDRRETEKQARAKLDSKATDYDKDAVYRGLRSAQNTFHEIITGYLTPAQKQALETDRVILQEKQKRLAKIPPPPPPAPTVTVVPMDSTAIKGPEKTKGKGKKSKKKSKPIVQ